MQCGFRQLFVRTVDFCKRTCFAKHEKNQCDSFLGRYLYRIQTHIKIGRTGLHISSSGQLKEISSLVLFLPHMCVSVIIQTSLALQWQNSSKIILEIEQHLHVFQFPDIMVYPRQYGKCKLETTALFTVISKNRARSKL